MHKHPYIGSSVAYFVGVHGIILRRVDSYFTSVSSDKLSHPVDDNGLA